MKTSLSRDPRFAFYLSKLYTAWTKLLCVTAAGNDSKSSIPSSLKECSSIPVCSEPIKKNNAIFDILVCFVFFIVSNDNTAVICLLRHAYFPRGFMKANCQSHCSTLHVFGEGYITRSDAKVYIVDKLKSKLTRQKKWFSSSNEINKLSTEVSISVSHKFIKHGIAFSREGVYQLYCCNTH